MTPYEILTHLAKIRKTAVARTVQARCGSTVTCTSLLTLYGLAQGQSIKGKPLGTRREKLFRAGYIQKSPCPNGTQEANHKIVEIISLTKKGKEVIGKLEKELTKISERIEKNESRD